MKSCLGTVHKGRPHKMAKSDPSSLVRKMTALYFLSSSRYYWISLNELNIVKYVAPQS